ncbi:5-formyltetrahydrofolate cyclo-ligase [Rhodovibrionaceae bacterium A322]
MTQQVQQQISPNEQDLNVMKDGARKSARAARKAAAAASPQAAQDMAARFLSQVPLRQGAVVSGYWPIQSELDPRPLLRALADKGHRICLPVIVENHQPLIFREWHEGDDLENAGFNTFEPKADRPELLPEVLLVPLLAFDRQGYRLGYGGGFYDRTLEKLRGMAHSNLVHYPHKPQAIALAYEAQEIDQVPTNSTDQPMDLVVTEQSLHRFSSL